MKENQELYTLNIPDSHKPRVVIIGGGFGGLINLLRDSAQRFCTAC